MIEMQEIPAERILRLYERVSKEYRALSLEDLNVVNPAKIVVDAKPGTDTGIMLNPLAAMVAKISDGTAGVKAVHLDELTGKITAYTSMFYPDGSHESIEGDEITVLRSALMAVFATEGRVALGPDSVVGFIGAGRINALTALCLNTIFGVRVFVISGRPGKPVPMKNFDKLKDRALIVLDYLDTGFESMRKTDVVFVATTAMDESDALKYEDLEGPKLFVASDSGYVLGPTFRKECISFSDCPRQVVEHWRHEFPWDEYRPMEEEIYTLNEFPECDRPAAVYLYGIMLGDVAVAASDREAKG